MDGREVGTSTASRMEALSTGDRIEEREQEIVAGGGMESCIATLHTDCIRFGEAHEEGRIGLA